MQHLQKKQKTDWFWIDLTIGASMYASTSIWSSVGRGSLLRTKILKMDVDENHCPWNLVLCPFRPFCSRKTDKSLQVAGVHTKDQLKAIIAELQARSLRDFFVSKTFTSLKIL